MQCPRIRITFNTDNRPTFRSDLKKTLEPFANKENNRCKTVCIFAADLGKAVVLACLSGADLNCQLTDVQSRRPWHPRTSLGHMASTIIEPGIIRSYRFAFPPMLPVAVSASHVALPCSAGAAEGQVDLYAPRKQRHEARSWSASVISTATNVGAAAGIISCFQRNKKRSPI